MTENATATKRDDYQTRGSRKENHDPGLSINIFYDYDLPHNNKNNDNNSNNHNIDDDVNDVDEMYITCIILNLYR